MMSKCKIQRSVFSPIVFTYSVLAYISGWKMLSNNRKLWEVSLASVTLALDVYSKQQK